MQLPEQPPQDDDGVTARLAARKSGIRKPKRRKQPRESVLTATAFGIPEQKAYDLLDEAARRSVKPTNLQTVLPYDLQKLLFDELVPERPQKDPEGWVGTSLRFVADAARFVNPFGARDSAAVYAAAMAHEGEDSSSAADAFAAAAAIASSTSVASLDTAEVVGLRAAVAAARAVANVDEANVFATTIGMTSLVAAARLLSGAEKASALTALANLAIMLPKSRARLLQVEDGSLVETLSRVIYESGRLAGWQTEALVSGTHLLGSLALARGKVGADARRNMALDKELVRGLQRLAGGLKHGEPEGAARAARRALGTLGINKWVPRMPGQRGLRILCIDGGGTRAIMAFEMVRVHDQHIYQDT